jgi:hypothetical protein
MAPFLEIFFHGAFDDCEAHTGRSGFQHIGLVKGTAMQLAPKTSRLSTDFQVEIS